MVLELSKPLVCRHRKDEWRIVISKDYKTFEIICCTDCRNTLRSFQICEIIEEHPKSKRVSI